MSKKEKYFKMVHDNIKKYGFHTTYVMEEKGFTPFGYSTGIYKNFEIPDVFISGLPSGLTAELIENYVDGFKFKQVPINEVIDDLIDRFPIYFNEVNIELLDEYVLSSFKFYGNEYFSYIQLIFPDLNGYFPEEIGYDYDQEILS